MAEKGKDWSTPMGNNHTNKKILLAFIFNVILKLFVSIDNRFTGEENYGMRTILRVGVESV